MPRRSILTVSERVALLGVPTNQADLLRFHSLSERDLSLIHQRRGDSNRLGFAVQLCYLRYPGCALTTDEDPPLKLLSMVAEQLHLDTACWPNMPSEKKPGGSTMPNCAGILA